jgi:lipopolysaccharide biosynthesis glycosyltransferase
MSDRIPIFLAADNKYARYCAVTITSILENTSQPDRLKFFVLSSDISNENTEKLKQICHHFSSEIFIVHVDLSLFSSFPMVLEHINLNTYSRFLIPELCSDYKQAIYLDCDIIVLSDIAHLFDKGIDTKPIGAVPHVALPYQDTFVRSFDVRGDDIYFNAGILVIDIDLWKQKQYSKTIVQYCTNNIQNLTFADQDALNVLFWQNYHHLPGVWNVESRLYKEKLLGLPQDQETNYRTQNPAIIHYTGPDKPWASQKYVPMRHLYIRYSEQLTNEFGWLPSNPEPKRCSVSAFLEFLLSCLYFRFSYNFRKIFPKNSIAS